MIRSRHILAIIVIVITAIGLWNMRPYYIFAVETLGISPFKLLLKGTSILNPVNNNVGILILGIPGEKYDGPYLSDTIIAANINLTDNHVTLVSLPRDIWSPTIKEKINAAYAIGRAKRKLDGGIKLAKAEVGAIVGFPVDYAVIIRFETFEKLIDALAGIDITVEKSFTDTEFPVPGKADDECNGDPKFRCRYMTVSFSAGKQHMDGKRALIFARSRHSTGSEGSDFARGKRQQLIIAAIKDKVLEIVKKRDLNTLNEFYKTVNSTIERDIENQQLAALTFHILKSRNFSHASERLSPELFRVPPLYEYDGRYVLVPKAGNYYKVHKYISCLIEKHTEEYCLK